MQQCAAMFENDGAPRPLEPISGLGWILARYGGWTGSDRMRALESDIVHLVGRTWTTFEHLGQDDQFDHFDQFDHALTCDRNRTFDENDLCVPARV